MFFFPSLFLVPWRVTQSKRRFVETDLLAATTIVGQPERSFCMKVIDGLRFPHTLLRSLSKFEAGENAQGEKHVK